MSNAVDERVVPLVAQVNEAIAGATWGILTGDPGATRSVVETDTVLRQRVDEVRSLAWERLERPDASPAAARHLFGLLLVVSDLERTVRLTGDIAELAHTALGATMTPVARGVIQRLSEVAISLWRTVADAYAEDTPTAHPRGRVSPELATLRQRLDAEVASGSMDPPVADEVSVLGRLYDEIAQRARCSSQRVAPESPLTA